VRTSGGPSRFWQLNRSSLPMGAGPAVADLSNPCWRLISWLTSRPLPIISSIPSLPVCWNALRQLRDVTGQDPADDLRLTSGIVEKLARLHSETSEIASKTKDADAVSPLRATLCSVEPLR
jgi:hypothetical protein